MGLPGSGCNGSTRKWLQCSYQEVVATQLPGSGCNAATRKWLQCSYQEVEVVAMWLPGSGCNAATRKWLQCGYQEVVAMRLPGSGCNAATRKWLQCGYQEVVAMRLPGSCRFLCRSFTFQYIGLFLLSRAGIQYLRDYLHLPQEIVPATLKRPVRAETTRPKPRGRCILRDTNVVMCICDPLSINAK